MTVEHLVQQAIDEERLVYAVRQVDIDAAGRAFVHFSVLAHRQLLPTFHAFADSIASIGRELERMRNSMADAMYAAATDAYRCEFGRLPGSDRTARLRKKRRKIVLQWFLQQSF